MQFLFELGVFGGKVFLLVLGIAVLLILIFVLVTKARKALPSLSVVNLNRRYQARASAVKESVWDAKAFKLEEKALKKKLKNEKGQEKKRLYVLGFDGDLQASHVENLREEVTTLLSVARPGTDNVVVTVESPGGLVHSYGLAAAQLLRLRQAGLHLTVCVDKVAASGGYMMACTANHIVAAPFAILGSIGVVAPVANFHRLLKKHDVDYEEMTAGEFKRTISRFGEITEGGKRKFIEQLEDTHTLFKMFVKEHRPQVELAQIATGEYWFGQRALALRLVDELSTSDDYIFRQREEREIYHLEVAVKKKWSEKLAENIARLFLRTYRDSRLELTREQFPS